MRDEQKTKAELLQELETLRRRVSGLKQAAEQWSQTFDATSDLVFVQDKDFRFVKVNKSVCDLLKVKPEDLIGKKCYEVVHKSNKPWPNCPLAKVLKDKRPHTEQVYDPNIGIPLLISTSPIFDENGELTSVVHIATDITERKKAEEMLGAERQRLYSLLDGLPAFVYLQAPDHSVRFANRYFREHFGDPEGKRCYEVLWGAKEPCKPCPTFRVFDTKEPQIWEWSQSPDGRIYEINDYPFSDVDGSPLVLELGIDITERKRAEEKLKVFEEMFSDLAERSFDLIFRTDAQGYLTYISRGSEKILHYKPEEMVGTHFKNYLIESEIPQVSQRFAENIRGENLGIFEMEAMRKDGSSVFIELNSSPILEDGETIGIQGIIRDITERKKAEDDLLFKSTLLEAQSETSIDGILVVDSEGKSISFNKNFGRMWNIPQQILDTRDDEKMLQYVLAQLKNPDQFLEKVKYLYAHKSEKSRDEIQFRDGRVFDRYSSPLLDSNDEYYGRVWYFRDITERKKAENELKESEERFRAIFDNAADGILLADPESKRFHSGNRVMGQMLGCKPEEIKNLGVVDIHPEEGLPYVIEQFEKQSWGKFTLSRDIPVKRKDGSVFYADVNSVGIALRGKRYLMGIFRDVTERKRAEEALRDSESKYRTLVENLPQKIFLKDKNSVYVSCNDNLARDFKIKSEEITGKTDYDLLPKELAEKYRADDKRIIESGQTEAIEEKYIQEGEERIIHTVKTPVKDEQGNIIGVLGIFWDITELKRREEDLNIYRENMVQAEELAAVGTLSATLAHELTQPLTVIGLSIGNSLAELEKISCPDTVVEDLKEGLSEISSMTSMVERFRNFAKMSTKRTVSEVDFKAIAERIAKLLDTSAWRAKVTLQVEGMDKLPLIYSYERDLEQLFFSLIENAIQAADGKKKRRVIISGAVRDKHIELQFSDNCGGIAPENLDRIFEPFFTTKYTYERTGLGLCVVERIVSQLGGKVRVESKLGKGSTFFVTLPINRSERQLSADDK